MFCTFRKRVPILINMLVPSQRRQVGQRITVEIIDEQDLRRLWQSLPLDAGSAQLIDALITKAQPGVDILNPVLLPGDDLGAQLRLEECEQFFEARTQP